MTQDPSRFFLIVAVVFMAATGGGCELLDEALGGGGSGSATDAGATPAPGACQTDSDCRLFSDYCTGCDCRALSRGQSDPSCAGPGVRCLADPCQRKSAQCVKGRCAVAGTGSAPHDP